jgi:hypothetical protein
MSLKAATCSTCWEDIVVATCDKCPRSEEHHGTVESVTEFLRKKGWVTRPGERPSLPFQWVCPMCAS